MRIESFINEVVSEVVNAAKAGCDAISELTTPIHGNHIPKTETFPLTGFDKIRVGSAINATIQIGDEFSVTITADEAVYPKLTLHTIESTLIVHIAGTLISPVKTEIQITLPSLRSLEVSGATTTSVKDIKNTAFNLTVSGASKLTLTGQTDNLEASVSGASIVDLTKLNSTTTHLVCSGASTVQFHEPTSTLKVDLSGASRVEAGKTQDLEINATGASTFSAKVSNEVRASATGASSIRVGKNAKIVSQSASGASTISAD